MKEKLKKLSPEFQRMIAELKISAKNCDLRIYLVGGVVRDLLLNREVYDLDIVVEGNAIKLAQDFSSRLSGDLLRHHSFGTASVIVDKHKIDFATSRSERYPTFGVLPLVKPADLTQDLFRRDFTINAMAISLNPDDYAKLIDPYKGHADLKAKQIRVLHDKSFCDDGTRILRAIKFEQRFGFKLASSSLRLISQAKRIGAINLIHPHRLRDELVLIAKEKDCAKIFKRVDQLYGLSFIYQGLKFSSKHQALFNSITKYLDWYKKNLKKHRRLQEHLLYLAGLLHKLNPKTIEGIMSRFDFKAGHKIIVTSSRAGLNDLKNISAKTSNHRVYEFFKPLSYETIVFLCAAYPKKWFIEKVKVFINKLSGVRLLIKGEDLQQIGIEPGQIYSFIFNETLKQKLDFGFKSKQEELEFAFMIAKKSAVK